MRYVTRMIVRFADLIISLIGTRLFMNIDYNGRATRDSLSDIAVFVRVTDAGSFTAAADKLSLPKSEARRCPGGANGLAAQCYIGASVRG